MSGNRMVQTRLGALLRGGVGVLPMLAAIGLMSLNPASVSARAVSPQVQADYPVTVTLIPNPRTDVTFSENVFEVGPGEGLAETTAMFQEPGEYVLIVQVLGGAFDNQCCWTNGYVEVTVGP